MVDRLQRYGNGVVGVEGGEVFGGRIAVFFGTVGG